MEAALRCASLTADALFDGRTLLDDCLNRTAPGADPGRPAEAATKLAYARALVAHGTRITSWSGSLLVDAVRRALLGVLRLG